MPYLPDTEELTRRLVAWPGFLEPVGPMNPSNPLAGVTAPHGPGGSRRTYFGALAKVGGSDLNFEGLIDLADELAHYLANQASRDPTYWWRARALFDLRPEFAAWEQHQFALRHVPERARVFILREVATAAAGLRAIPSIVPALERLAGVADLRVHSLNYDDLPFSANLAWITGFAPDGRFELTTDWKLAQHTLVQMHGSVRWATTGSEMTFFRSSVRAGREWDGTVGMSAARAYQDGRIAPHSPMITGLRKTDAILSEPYGTYFQLFRQELLSTNRWLIVGYGFGDPHVNAALRSAWASWRQQAGYAKKGLRVLIVAWASDADLQKDGGMAGAGTVLQERLRVLSVCPEGSDSERHRDRLQFSPYRFERGTLKQLRGDLALSFDGTSGVFSDRPLEQSVREFLFG